VALVCLIHSNDHGFYIVQNTNEEKMPKLKTKSSVKKRFKITASGKVKASQAGKQHFMRRRTKAQLRNQRGTTILCPQDAKNIVKFFMPYG
jgi:large subunit ribosomal protein L35